MGCGSSSFNDEKENDEENAFKNVWRYKLSRQEAKEAYIKDGTLPASGCPDLLTLRVFLEDPSSLFKLATEAKKVDKLDLLLCWLEALEYKSITVSSREMKLSKANNFYHKYIKEDAVLMSMMTMAEDREKIHQILEEAEFSTDIPIPDDLFDSVCQKVLIRINDELFSDFKLGDSYVKSVDAMTHKFNKVKLDDFSFFKKLGHGSFGMVVECAKKSTGVRYAMKIQSKRGMLKCFRDCPHRVVFEKEAVMKCRHPFIISMDYAFQTPELTLIVMDLGTSGNLGTEMKISEARVMFYTAEIILALNHIHNLGLIYRDLKPGNVLLNADGHIKLVDMGGVIDVDGGTLGYYEPGLRQVEDDLFGENERCHSSAPGLLSGALSAMKSKSRSGKVGFASPDNRSADSRGMQRSGLATKSFSYAEPPSLQRATSVMGTSGFMAPEMLAMLVQKSNGYTKAVDYWSLGVSMFFLLTGKVPFHNNRVAAFISFVSDRENDGSMPPDYARFYENISGLVDEDVMSEKARNIITSFLQIKELDRLGGRRNDIERIQKHEFFSSLEWGLLEQKLIEPPYIPPISDNVSESDDFPYDCFDTMLFALGRVGLTHAGVPQKMQKFFSSWDFVSPGALKAELGVQQKMEQVIALQKMSTVGFTWMGVSNVSSTADSALNASLKEDASRGESGMAVASLSRSMATSLLPSRMQSRDESGFSAYDSALEPQCVSPTNHGVAASFGITKNANAVHKATNLLKALDKE